MAIPHCEDDPRVGYPGTLVWERYPTAAPFLPVTVQSLGGHLCSTLALSGHAPGPLRASLAACSTRSLSRPPWLRSTERADTVEAGVL